MRGVLYTMRLLRIIWVLLRWDAVFLVPSPALLWLGKRLRKKAATPLRPGERLSEALQALGASFIKLGQVLATRADLLGEAVARDLTTLQDRLPPFPTKKAIQTIETELGKPLSALFSEFDPKPVAAASIAQVHKATTLDGETVAVKVVRPGVRQQFARDLRLFAWIARQLESTSPLARRLKLVQMVAAVRQTLEMETNLRYEAAAADELRENCEPFGEL
ncbi:MAG: ABC1 kinase family protein, partial [Holosporales bacterium]